MAMGRPRKEIDRKQAENLARIQCTRDEIADFFDVSADTIERRCAEWGFETFAAFFKTYAAEGKSSLRREQYKLAMKGNATMLIWLGKQYLGQRDQIDHSTKGGMEFTLNYTPRSKRDKENEE